MKVDERRKEILKLLMRSNEPISGNELANRFEVSRQVIVGDISAIKAEGADILSTHYGYMFRSTPYVQRVFKIKHTKENTLDELETIVGLGGIVVDVYVWHKVYGRVEAALNISTLWQVEKFMEGVRSGKSTELMNITGGYHYHTVRASDEATLDKIEKALNKKGYIVPSP